MIGRTNTGGGGGGGLNFSVVGGTTAPSNPKENMIWVNTSVAITTWVFSATVPENPVQGMVWISTGTSSTVAFNALKKNGIQVYPISAKQCVSGAWVDKTAKSYQGGEWADWWNGELYTPGNEWENITGGWVARAWKGQAGIIGYEKAPTIASTNDSMVITYAQSTHGVAEVANDIDLTKVSTISVTYKASGPTSRWLNLVIVPRNAQYWRTNKIAEVTLVNASTFTTVTIDVSSISGSYDVVFGGGQNDGGAITLTIQSVIMK